MAKKEDLAHVIAESLNKSSDSQIAYILGDSNSIAPTLLTDFISTGSSILDLAISNRPHGGIACGRITELQGNEGSGKSLISAHIMAETQKRGGVAVLIDTETAVNYDFFEAIGLDLKKMVYINENVIERIFEHIEDVIETVRKADKNKVVTIVVDSVAGATTEKEAESEHGVDGYATGKAIIISKALRKITKLIGDQKIALIFTNQLRQKMNAMPFADQYTTSGGKSIAFHASTRIRLSLAGTIKSTDKEVVGVIVEAKVIKNRLGPPYRKARFNVLFDRGIDDYNSWYDYMKEKKLFGGSAQAPTWEDPVTGETIKFKKSTFVEDLLSDSERKDRVYMHLCDTLIKEYASTDTLVETEELPEE